MFSSQGWGLSQDWGSYGVEYVGTHLQLGDP